MSEGSVPRDHSFRMGDKVTPIVEFTDEMLIDMGIDPETQNKPRIGEGYTVLGTSYSSVNLRVGRLSFYYDAKQFRLYNSIEKITEINNLLKSL